MSSPDAELFLLLSSFSGNPVLDTSMLLLAEISLFAVPAAMFYLWFQGTEGRRDSILTGFAVLVGVSFTYVMGMFYFHHQPFTAYEAIVAAQPNNAFPSQHTALAFSAFWTLLWRSRKKISAVVGVAGVAAGFARVFVGFHYPVDIAGGVIAGLAGLSAAYVLSKTSLPDAVIKIYGGVEKSFLRYSGKLFKFLHN